MTESRSRAARRPARRHSISPRSELLVNKRLKALCITIPPLVLVRADEVIQ